VHYVGFREDLDTWIKASDLVTLPSYREGVPRSLIEALAYGKAVVTSDVPGCRETVLDGWNGYLCRVKDPVSLADSISRIDASKVTQFGQNSRIYCEEKFDARLLVNQTLQEYGIEKR
jgi:N,N'-diacetylbacillosaminyl-diphospho-undecaprenol alpha-1,3-N-acetylgalactosaminyltransferase